MLLSWRVRYLDTRDKQFKDRDLWLETNALDPVTKAAVEATHELRDVGRGREMLRYRHLFHEKRYTGDELNELHTRHGRIDFVSIDNYFEDEHGNELTNKQMAVALTGSPNAIMFPPGAKQHDIDYALADRRPIPVDQIVLSQEHLNVLGYFVRDLREMLSSAFYNDGPGSLVSAGGTDFALKTAVTDEEIRSFVTIFRRLYMDGEPASFLKAAAVFGDACQGYSLANWVKGVAGEYEKELDEKPHFAPFAGPAGWSFSRKRLIDVFVYTQYAHQPDGRRAHQFQECLASAGGKRPLLTWLFLTELWQCALHMRNAGVVIAGFYERYCQYHKVSCDLLASVRSDNPGLGTLEKKEDRRERILREKTDELAAHIWTERGRPEGGPAQFSEEARLRLEAAITGKADVRGEIA
jgi:hypothetical protein